MNRRGEKLVLRKKIEDQGYTRLLVAWSKQKSLIFNLVSVSKLWGKWEAGNRTSVNHPACSINFYPKPKMELGIVIK